MLPVHEMFQAQVCRTPDATAVTDSTTETDWSYRDLNRLANRMAHVLCDRGIGRGDLVGLHVPRSTDCVALILAVLKTGAGYVPLEPSIPTARRDLILTDSAPRLTVSDGDLDVAHEVLTLAELRRVSATAPDHDPAVPVSTEDIAYVPYTSGTTGRPKGAAVPHRSVPGFFEGTDYALWGAGATVVLHSALTWDGHLIDLFPALTGGGRVLVPAAGLDPVDLVRTTASAGATTIFLTTAVVNLIAAVDPEALAGFRSVVFGGEAVSARHLRRVLAAAPRTRFAHAYGPSECTAFSTMHVITDREVPERVPIGRGVGDRVVHVLDDRLRPVGPGGSGELYVSGPGVAHGYLRRAPLTAERFLPDPFSGVPGARMYRSGDVVRVDERGDLEFVGRRDNQVKIRGFRIELDEVEAALAAHPSVGTCVVVPQHFDDDRRLVGYVTAAPGGAADPEELRAHLGGVLPAYQVPAVVVVLDALPLTGSGKVDRAALPPVATARPTPEPGEPEPTGLSSLIGSVWAAVLGVEQVVPSDNFMSLGGHSLLAVRTVHVLRGALGVHVPLGSLLTTRDLAAFSESVEDLLTAKA